MTPAERAAFAAKPQGAVLATLDDRGRTHAVPVIYLFEEGEFLVITERGSKKHRNAVASGRASLCMNAWPQFRYVTVEGPVRVEDSVSYETRLRLHTHYRGEEAALKATADGAHQKMVALMLTPEHWLG